MTEDTPTGGNPRISGYLDGELDPEERAAFEEELARSPELRRELEAFRATKEVTDAVQLIEFPDAVWDRYWESTYNRLERQLGWIVLSIGAMIVLGFAGYNVVMSLVHDTETPVIVRLGIGLLCVGGAILFISVLRERIFTRKTDPYRGVRR